jgi:glycosyltransferase involved in cell wall biosynthesis
MTWHVLDARSIWIQEFTAALSQLVPTLGWIPRFEWTGLLDKRVTDMNSVDPRFNGRLFPLQRGYSRAPISWLARTGTRLVQMLEQADPQASRSTLVCTTPFYAPVAENWPGPVVYYLTDLTTAYAGIDPDQVRRLDRRLCRVAVRVCPNSQRIADYCVRDAACDPAKIVIIPNATRQVNVAPRPLLQPEPLPGDLEDLPRPVLGVIGNLADNMDWLLLEEAVRLTPDFSWAFVGPTDMPIADVERRRARQRMLAAGGRVRFTGMRKYGELRDYARAFDAAILPYRRHEPTFSGSCTRFYEHLAACRPMFGTRGFAELLEKEPLIHLFDRPQELADSLNRLRRDGVNDDLKHALSDGREELRWQASPTGTWEARAAAMVEAVAGIADANTSEGHVLAGARA